MKNSSDQIITVGLYVRVSTEEQKKHGYSIQAQKEALISYCKEKQYKIYDIYADEGKSARSKLSSRTHMKRLLEDIKAHKINRVVFIKLDRWFRNVKDYYKIQEILEKNKVDWETTQEEYNTTTAAGRLNLNIRLSVAQDEADRTSERIKFVFENMIVNKRAIQGSHCMPLGYIVAGEEKNKHVIKDPETNHIVEDMFKHFSTYGSIRKTLIYINNKYNLSICYDSMRHYFLNPLYTGFYKNIENYCEPYITKKQFEENLSKLKRNVKDNNKKHDYIFSGLLKCYSCGKNLSGFKYRCTKPKYNKVYTYYAYRCNHAYNTKLCPNRSPILENKLEDYLIKNIISSAKQYIIKEETIEKKEEKVIDVDKIKKKIERLSELYIDGKISREKYDTDFEKFTNEINNASIKQEKKKDLNNLKSLINADALKLYEQLDNQLKRTFWSTYIDYIERDKNLNFIVHFK